MKYVPIHCHTHFSILDGFGTPQQNVDRAVALGIPALGISDHGNIFGHVEHWKACKSAGIKSILGCELYISHKPAFQKDKTSRFVTHMVVWAKNRQGWDDLVELVSQTNDPAYFYYKPRIHLWNEQDEDGILMPGLEHFLRGNIMGFSGHQGSHLSDNLFCDLFAEDSAATKAALKAAYAQKKDINSPDYYRKFLKDNWFEDTCQLALRFQEAFGKGNFFIELQNELNPNDKLALWVQPIIVECLRAVGKETGIPCLASSDPHYPSPDDARDQRMMVMNNMKETEQSVKEKLSSEDENDVMVFFGSDSFYIHSQEEMEAKFTKEEIDNTNMAADSVEMFDISHKPHIPPFEIPEYDTSTVDRFGNDMCSSSFDKFLFYLCLQGCKKIKPWESSEYSKQDYWNRIREEFAVIAEAKLSSYFLVVWDYCMAADNRPSNHSYDWYSNMIKGGDTDPIPRGVGRGSAAGCLVSYLIGITGIDPLKYGLIFGRFYNKGRNTDDHVELPDIDIDFAVEDRDWVIQYLSNKYGTENVAQIVTFQKMQGRAAMKDIFRIKGIMGGFELANEISKMIPSEAEVADQLQDMREAGYENYGLIQYAVDNVDDIMKFYEKPELKAVFDQAMRCEGRKRALGRHPSGVIVTPKPVRKCFPMAYDTKHKDQIIGVDMNDAATLGGIKLDILGTAILDKLKMTQDLVNGKTPKRKQVEFTEEVDD